MISVPGKVEAVQFDGPNVDGVPVVQQNQFGTIQRISVFGGLTKMEWMTTMLLSGHIADLESSGLQERRERVQWATGVAEMILNECRAREERYSEERSLRINGDAV